MKVFPLRGFDLAVGITDSWETKADREFRDLLPPSLLLIHSVILDESLSSCLIVLALDSIASADTVTISPVCL